MWARVIDSRGEWWDAGSRRLRMTLHLGDVDGDVTSLLIDKLGFIGVSFNDARAIVRLSPKSVSKVALVRLYYWLSTQFHRRIALSVGPAVSNQHYEFFASGRDVLLRLESVLDPECRRSWMPLFAARTGNLANLPQGSALAVLFEHWRCTGGVFAEDSYRTVLNRFAGDRYVIFAPGAASGNFTVARAGEGLLIPDKHAHRALTGSGLENIADHEYAGWVSRFYSAALDSQQPRCDHIRAYIRWPRAGRTERRYSRVILPCRTSDGQQLLLGVSGPLAVPDRDLEAA